MWDFVLVNIPEMRLWKGDMQSSCWVNVNRRHTHANTNLGRVNYCLGKEREKQNYVDGRLKGKKGTHCTEEEVCHKNMKETSRKWNKHWRKLIRGVRNIWGFRRKKCKEKHGFGITENSNGGLAQQIVAVFSVFPLCGSVWLSCILWE